MFIQCINKKQWWIYWSWKNQLIYYHTGIYQLKSLIHCNLKFPWITVFTQWMLKYAAEIAHIPVCIQSYIFKQFWNHLCQPRVYRGEEQILNSWQAKMFWNEALPYLVKPIFNFDWRVNWSAYSLNYSVHFVRKTNRWAVQFDWPSHPS